MKTHRSSGRKEIMTDQHPTEVLAPGALPTLSIAVADTAALRLARVLAAHNPDEFSGIMCAECGFLAPCPTRRMADGTTEVTAPWRHGQVITGALVSA
jgi:hypothetical protein